MASAGLHLRLLSLFHPLPSSPAVMAESQSSAIDKYGGRGGSYIEHATARKKNEYALSGPKSGKIIG